MVAQMVKNPRAMQEARVQSLGQKDALEKGMATCFSILSGEFHGQRTSIHGVAKSQNNWAMNTFTIFFFHTMKVCKYERAWQNFLEDQFYSK